jgi:hypothetical protein
VTYLEEDIWRFVNRAPYLALSRPVRAVSFLERQLSLRAECFTGVDAYPELHSGMPRAARRIAVFF